jgi:enamine deaminase RidA (YjgF/YER057c/UK114 family)
MTAHESLVALDPPELAAPRGFSHTIAFGGLVLVSGQLPIDAERRLVGEGDPVQQARQVFDNLRIALAANGLGFEHIVKFTALVTTEDAYEAFRTVRDELIEPPFPTSTVACVTDIVFPGAVIEIEAMAAVGVSRA